jgi:hypothetical protein
MQRPLSTTGTHKQAPSPAVAHGTDERRAASPSTGCGDRREQEENMRLITAQIWLERYFEEGSRPADLTLQR